MSIKIKVLLLIPCFSVVTMFGSAQALEGGSLSEHQFDSTRISQFLGAFQDQKHQVKSMLIVHENELILEEYFNGTDPEELQDLRSVTKSVLSLLTGIAIHKGFIKSVDDPIGKYLEEFNKDGKELILVKHLLTMSTGLDCNDWDKDSPGQEDRIYKKKDWLEAIAELSLLRDPGDSALYCSAGTILLAEIISQGSKMPIDQFADQYLFQPLGIQEVDWKHTTKGKKVPPSSRRLHLKPIDLIKLGVLVQQGGVWNKQQIIPSSWIKASTQARTSITQVVYGYLWWRIPFNIKGQNTEAIVATGNGGQYIMIFTDLNMVISFTGEAFNSAEDKLPFAIVNNIILPSKI